MHHHDLELVNVFDTLAAHLVFASGLTHRKIQRQDDTDLGGNILSN